MARFVGQIKKRSRRKLQPYSTTCMNDEGRNTIWNTCWLILTSASQMKMKYLVGLRPANGCFYSLSQNCSGHQQCFCLRTFSRVFRMSCHSELQEYTGGETFYVMEHNPKKDLNFDIMHLDNFSHKKGHKSIGIKSCSFLVPNEKLYTD